jgi:hypothetical protein
MFDPNGAETDYGRYNVPTIVAALQKFNDRFSDFSQWDLKKEWDTLLLELLDVTWQDGHDNAE